MEMKLIKEFIRDNKKGERIFFTGLEEKNIRK